MEVLLNPHFRHLFSLYLRNPFTYSTIFFAIYGNEEYEKLNWTKKKN